MLHCSRCISLNGMTRSSAMPSPRCCGSSAITGRWPARKTILRCEARSPNSQPILVSSTCTRRCSCGSDGRLRPFSIFDSRLSEQPAASASCFIVQPLVRRAMRSRKPSSAPDSSWDGSAATAPAGFDGIDPPIQATVIWLKSGVSGNRPKTSAKNIVAPAKAGAHLSVRQCIGSADDARIQVDPIRILFLDQPDLPGAPPFLDLFLAANGRLSLIVELEPHKAINVMLRGEAQCGL